MSDRTFTLDEAQMLLPVLESLLKQAIQGKKLIEDVDAEVQETAHRIFLNGGTLVNVVHLAARKAAREKAIQRIKDAVAEIDATGARRHRSSAIRVVNRWFGGHRRDRVLRLDLRTLLSVALVGQACAGDH